MAKFLPPSLSEVAAYCKERGNGIGAEHFVDYYTANGWRVGRVPMKDWRAAIRTWEKNHHKWGTAPTMAPAAQEIGLTGEEETWLRGFQARERERIAKKSGASDTQSKTVPK